MQTTTVGFPHFSGGLCDEQRCNSASGYDGHTMWKTAADWARDHHVDGEECPSPNGCDSPGCRKVATAAADEPLPHCVTIVKPGMQPVFLGFRHAFQAEHAALSLNSQRHSVACPKGMTIEFGPTPEGVTPLPPLPNTPGGLVEAMNAEDLDESHEARYPDLYSRLQAQEGQESAAQLWKAACGLMDAEAEYAEQEAQEDAGAATSLLVHREEPALKSVPAEPFELPDEVADRDVSHQCVMRHDGQPTHGYVGWVEHEHSDTYGRDLIDLVWVPFYEIQLSGDTEPQRFCEDCMRWLTEAADHIRVDG